MRRVAAHRHTDWKVLPRPCKITAPLIAAPIQEELQRCDPAPQLGAVLAKAGQQYIILSHSAGGTHRDGFLTKRGRESAKSAGTLQRYCFTIKAARSHDGAVERDQPVSGAYRWRQWRDELARRVQAPAIPYFETRHYLWHIDVLFNGAWRLGCVHSNSPYSHVYRHQVSSPRSGLFSRDIAT